MAQQSKGISREVKRDIHPLLIPLYKQWMPNPLHRFLVRNATNRGKSWNSILFGFSFRPLGHKTAKRSSVRVSEPLSQKRKPQNREEERGWESVWENQGGEEDGTERSLHMATLER
ncbi:hypothetical protein AVEN_101617-1 [Araneus ventricosus]|uniref:Uncharacterized protein n=1 Tax=Araneus ventricosus TaxID=182803 RepID=A0A4Y2EZ28_ARAVE|nr:hypothetical protein AVEN_101617-1 [Araneus ventricosus]